MNKRSVSLLLTAVLTLGAAGGSVFCIPAGSLFPGTGTLSVHAEETGAVQEIVSEIPSDPDACAAFLEDLQNHLPDIEGYDWQMGDGEFHYPAGSEPRALKPVAFADVWGDETPEMLYICAPETYTADLRIVGLENGTLKELTAFPQWDVPAASGTSYALFRTAGDKTLYACSYIGDEIGFYSWYAFREEGGALAAGKIASADVHYADYDDDPDVFTVNGENVDQAAYDSFTEDLAARAEVTVLYSANPEMNTFFEQMFYLPSFGMSIDEAMSLLSGENAALPDDEQAAALPGDGQDLLSSLNGLSLLFSSGAGAWGSELVMQENGSFLLHYHDSDMGSSGEGYDATFYECEASGRFDNVQKVDDTTYTMHLAEISLENEPGTQWIAEEYGSRVLHIASDPYGLTDTDTVTVYLPGTPIDSIPEEALFKLFYEGNALDGVVILGEGDFYTSQLPGTVPAE